MLWLEHCAVVIPCLNEESHIRSLVQEIRSSLHTVIVVDDASPDRTAAFAESAGAHVLRLPSSSGKGNAIHVGLNHAMELGFKYGLIMDGDGQHEPSSMAAFFQSAEQTGADLIIGNRMGSSEPMPFLRRQVNRWMSRRLSRWAGRPLPDTQCGFRLIRLDAWSKLELQCSHFEVESEMLLAAIAAGFQVEFVPIRSIYRGEHSKINPVKDTLRWFKWVCSLHLQSRRKSRRSNPILAEDAA